jgi:hypothetical protein
MDDIDRLLLELQTVSGSARDVDKSLHIRLLHEFEGMKGGSDAQPRRHDLQPQV